MSIFEHNRWEIWNQTQHPYRHTLADFSYSNPAIGQGVTNLEQAMDWVFAVLYPNTQDSVEEVSDLPSSGNTINDMRVVQDDGDGKAATYRWEQREGDVAAKWYKIYDMDWGYDSILSGFLTQTQDMYVNKYGRDDIDDDGDPLGGVESGQHIYGGLSANTHLTLHANSGDGTGAQTGYVQLADNMRPTADSAWSLGTTAERWLKVWTDEITIGTMTVAGGSIEDSSGLVDFGSTDITTTGAITAGSITMSGTDGTFGTTTIGNGVISDTGGELSFDLLDLVDITSLEVGTLTVVAGSITDSSGSIDFDDENIATTGTFTAGVITGTQFNADNLRLDGNTLSSTNTDGDINLDPNGSGDVVITSGSLFTGDIESTGDVEVTGSLSVDNLSLNGNTLSSLDTNGNVILDPNGVGLVELGAAFFPSTDSSWDIGKTGNVWNKLWLDGSIGDGTTEIASSVLQSLRDINVGVGSGFTIFWDGTKWVSSAPDTEIDHGALTGLADDDHTQYALLAGRSGGQTITGGTAAGNDLTLESTSDVTKGNVFFSSVLAPTSDATLDIGDGSHQIHDLYIAGELIGARLQNATTGGRPSASAGTPGRIIWDTDLDDIFVDIGGTWRQITSEQYYEEDAVNWEGTATEVTYDVSSTVNNAKRMIWALKRNSADYEQIGCEIDFPSDTSVRVTVGIPLASGTYTLVGR